MTSAVEQKQFTTPVLTEAEQIIAEAQARNLDPQAVIAAAEEIIAKDAGKYTKVELPDELRQSGVEAIPQDTEITQQTFSSPEILGEIVGDHASVSQNLQPEQIKIVPKFSNPNPFILERSTETRWSGDVLDTGVRRVAGIEGDAALALVQGRNNDLQIAARVPFKENLVRKFITGFRTKVLGKIF